MKPFRLFLITAALILGGGLPAAEAITMSPSRQTVEVGQPARFTARGHNMLTSGGCTMIIDFGDGTTATMGVLPDVSGPEKGVGTFSIKHRYGAAGRYQVRVVGRDAGISCVFKPIQAAAEVNVLKARAAAPAVKPVMLPSGVVGIIYREELQEAQCKPAGSFRATDSRQLPPGLKLGEKGQIIGTPTRDGNYNFTVQMKCGEDRTLRQPYSLKVGMAALNVEVTPGTLNITSTSGSKRVVYDLNASVPVNARVVSESGAFFAPSGSGDANFGKATGRQLGVFDKKLTAQLVNGKADNVAESILIPPAVIKRAQQLGVTRLLFRRTFTSAVTASGTASLQLQYTGAAAADFTVSRMRIYFENNRPEITFKRNQTRGRAVRIDLDYVGSGKLEGRWEYSTASQKTSHHVTSASGSWRLIKRVIEHLTYGRGNGVSSKTITLDPNTSKTQLPTHAPGTHRVRFVVEKPGRQIDFPQAVYFVTAEQAPIRYTIELTSPSMQAEGLPFIEPLVFTWKGSEALQRYKVEILGEDQNPVLATYTRTTAYKLLPEKTAEYLSAGRRYTWRVKGFDPDNQLVAESGERSFSFKAVQDFVPGQVLLVLQQNGSGSDLLDALERKYGLTPLTEFGLESLKMKVVLYETDQDVLDTVAGLAAETGIVSAQPNYIFRTLAEPMGDMQGLYRTLNLDKVHAQHRGSDVTVAVVDTGVDVDHEDLRERVGEFESYIDDGAYMAELHGTAVAGIISAALNDFGIAGIAPEAGLFAARACRQINKNSPSGECFSVSLSRALDAAIIKRVGLVNLSLGAAIIDPLLEKLLGAGAEVGILFVAPAGNSADQAQVAFPASDPRVIAVAGTDAQGKPLPNAVVAAMAEVSAPATGIFTTLPGNRHNFLSGTSLSTAVISGILALAEGKNGPLKRGELPHYEGDLCRWQEQLLGLSLCEP